MYSAALTGALPPHTSRLPRLVPGVAVEGSDAHQGAQALVGEGPQLGQFGQQRPSQDRADAGDALEERLVLLEGGARLDGFVELALVRRSSFSSHSMWARMRL